MHYSHSLLYAPLCTTRTAIENSNIELMSYYVKTKLLQLDAEAEDEKRREAALTAEHNKQGKLSSQRKERRLSKKNSRWKDCSATTVKDHIKRGSVRERKKRNPLYFSCDTNDVVHCHLWR